MRTRILVALAALLCLAAGAQVAWSQTGGRAGAAASFRLVKVASGLSSPVYATSAPGDTRLFVVEQEGTIRTVSKGKVAAKPYADLRSVVQAGGEQGLLSVAFSPSFAKNGKLYVYFTNKAGNEVVWELHARKGAASVRPGHRQLLEIPDTESNHNGGQLQFGPDGMLYIGDGDGGGGGDQHGAHGNGQNPGVLLGKLMRIDVTTRSDGLPYGIPKDNPFVGQSGWRPEIWALGLRNPWRFSFDRANGDLWIGDVGQNEWEEVDHLKHGVGGINFGWNRYEGRHDFAEDTPLAGGKLRMPVAEYSHSEGCSITGGYVYRGPKISGLSGRYVYADYCSGKMWTLATSGGVADATSRASSRTRARSRSSPSERADQACCTCARPRERSTASLRASRSVRLRGVSGARERCRDMRHGRDRARRHAGRPAERRALPRDADRAHRAERRCTGGAHVRAAHARGRDAGLPRAAARPGRELRGRVVSGRPPDPPERRARLGARPRGCSPTSCAGACASSSVAAG